MQVKQFSSPKRGGTPAAREAKVHSEPATGSFRVDRYANLGERVISHNESQIARLIGPINLSYTN
jgi:hypothetical protein